MIRIQKPDLQDHLQISMCASNLLMIFGDDLSSKIDSEMSAVVGADWLSSIAQSNEKYRNFNLRDMSTVLKDLTRNGQSALRFILIKKLNDKEKREFFDSLDDVLGERNAWIHRQVDATPDALADLVSTIRAASVYMELPILTECDYLRSSTNDSSVIGKQEVFKTDSEIENALDEVNEVLEKNQLEKPRDTEDEIEYGSPITGKMLSHSYVLRINGQIENRANGQILSTYHPEFALGLGTLLLSRKPQGGRIRITHDGLLCAFINDGWGYLAKVEEAKWFPGHLS